MVINIRDKETQKRIRELCKLTGESATKAVTEAVRERLELTRLKQSPKLAERLLEIGRDCASHLQKPTENYHESLYADDGLPE
jgi:antitoxin VapB